MKFNRRSLRPLRVADDTRGAVLIEFALIAPILALLLVGSIELSNYLLFNEKMESASMQTLGIINQSTNVDKGTLDAMFSAFDTMMLPSVVTNKRIIITQIKRPAAPLNCRPVVAWQYPRGGSKLGVVGGTATTGEINLSPGDSLIAIEVSTDYPMLLDMGLAETIIGNNPELYKRRFEHSRYGAFNIDPVTDQVAPVPCRP